MRKQNILIIGTTDIKGGAAKVSWNLGNRLREDGWWVKHIVGYKHSNSPHVHQLSTPMGRDASLYVRHLHSYLLANDQDYGQDEEILNHPWYRQADIVHLHNTHGNYISLRAIEKISQEKKLVWTLHDMWSITSHCANTDHPNSDKHDPLDCSLNSYPPILWNNKKKLWKQKESILSEMNIHFVCPSNWLKSRIEQVGYKNANISHIQNGTDGEVFKSMDKKACRSKLGFLPEEKIALFIAEGGIKNTNKGSDSIYQLAENNKDIRFVVIGGDKDYEEENIVYIPRVSDQKILSEHYGSADILVFPSQAENNPLVVLEALSCKLPVLAFNNSGTAELISHKKSGYLAKDKSMNDLQKGLLYLTSDKFTQSNFPPQDL